jgi:SAM-dependent methyltransferase
MNKLDANFWNQQYIDSNIGWDMGMVSPPLKIIIDSLEDKSAAILIPGCGSAYEAQYLLDQGFTNITLIDIAPALVAKLQKRWEGIPEIKVIEGDFFKLQGQFDIILEQTFFCALDPTLRPAYAAQVAHILAPKGQLKGILFSVEFEKQGPPFGGTIESYEQLFAPYFSYHFAPCLDSHPRRMGNESWVTLQKIKASNSKL